MSAFRFIPYKIDPNDRFSWNIVWVSLFAIGFALFFCVTPKISDDYWFMVPFRHWFESQGVMFPEEGGNIFTAGFPWQEYWDSIVYRYEYDNMRLSNMVGTPMLLFPKWIGSGIPLIMLVWSFLLSLRYADVNPSRSRLVPLAIFLWTFAMPWPNLMGSVIYQFNYVFSCWLVLLLYGAMARTMSTPKPGVWRIVGTLLLSVLVGFVHEGFGLPTATAIIVTAVCRKEWRRWESFCAAAIIFAASILLMTCPGMLMRMSTQVDSRGPTTFVELILIIVKSSQAFAVMIVMLVAVLFNSRLRRKVFTTPVIFFVSAATATFAVHVSSHADIRMSYLTEVSSIIVILYLLKTIGAPKFSAWPRIRNVCNGLMLSLTFILLGFNAYYCFRMRAELNAVLRAYVADPTETLYGHSPLEGRLKRATDYTFFVSALHFLRQYYEGLPIGNQYYALLVPDELSEATDSTGRDMGNGFRELATYHYLAADSLPGAIYFAHIQVDYGNGYENTVIMPIPFKSKANGKEYFWILTHEPLHGIRAPQIKSLKCYPKPE